MLQGLLRRAFERAGYEVSSATSGVEMLKGAPSALVHKIQRALYRISERELLAARESIESKAWGLQPNRASWLSRRSGRA
jgi:hypothetical protein